MRADKDALAALDAQVGLPDRDFQGDVALLPLGGAGGEGAVHRQGADRQVVALQGNDRAQHILDKLGGLRRARPGGG